MTDAPPVWNYSDVWESVASAVGETPAVIQDDRTLTWSQFDRCSGALAACLSAAGLRRQSKVAVYAVNGPEYLIAYFAAFKASLAPFNVNYRYRAEEVAYLLADGDAEALVFETTFTPVVDEIRSRASGVKIWIAIERDDAPAPPWAVSFSDCVTQRARTFAPGDRSADDLLLLYTGGTTGMPKGVMWRQGDLLGRGNYCANPTLDLPPLSRPSDAGPRAKRLPARPRALVAPPLMHGTGLIAAMAALSMGGTVLLLPGGRFDAGMLWDVAAREKATRVTIVGEPFAQPMLAALEAHPGRWDLSTILVISSSGAMWSRENKLRLLHHLPQASLIDSFSSSEAFGMGLSTMTANEEIGTARFTLGADCGVFTEDGRRVQPGAGERGKVAIGGFIPLGYYKDAAKTAAAFPTIEGSRWSMSGDWAEVAADGEIILLGRGSQCITTGGEKVFPEEVEEVLKRHAGVLDAAVTGVPHAMFGEHVAALVRLSGDGPAPSAAELIEYVRARIANYKAPRHVWMVDDLNRGPNGKLDYAAIRARVLDLLR